MIFFIFFFIFIDFMYVFIDFIDFYCKSIKKHETFLVFLSSEPDWSLCSNHVYDVLGVGITMGMRPLNHFFCFLPVGLLERFIA